ncbi:hypothetical protein D6851_02650 [Altericroceibacterium spongiae]|uniref:Uncharacterized protein n=1 Tax=Altericroceibacterium spongiae TaxID=2320269 RepID=A0A420ERT9_9SPHN|nr:hypothetical protein [Altericroceibacterium spongiae]RKF23389.1 hypothetical protein D6851_02650 [Altericroceibacterium spongiae]
MMGAFLTASGLLGLKNWIWIAIVAALIATAFVIVAIADNALDGAHATGVTQGATQQREGDLRETLERTERGNDAREKVEREAARGSGNALYDQCLRSNRGAAENCLRFLPEREGD